MIVFPPVAVVFKHNAVHRLDIVRRRQLRMLRQQRFFHHSQCKQTFPQRKRQRRTDLQDGNAVTNHLAQLPFRLIIGRMSFKDNPRVALERFNQCRRLFRIVFNDIFVAEFNARLHNDACDIRPRAIRARRFKCPFERFHGMLKRLRRRHRNAVFRFLCAARNRHFAADAVNRVHCIRAKRFQRCKLFLGGAGKRCAPARNRLIRKALCFAVCRNAHRGINVDLGKTGPDIIPDQLF